MTLSMLGVRNKDTRATSIEVLSFLTLYMQYWDMFKKFLVRFTS